MDFLLGAPGKLKAIKDWLTTYWTAARAAKLDYLTAPVAVASTALSNVTWSGDLATHLALVGEESPLTKIPITSGVLPPVYAIYLRASLTGASVASVQATTQSTSYSDVVNYTGAGVLEFCGHENADSSAHTMEIIIDGVTAYSYALPGHSQVRASIPVGAAGVAPYYTGSAVAYGAPVCSLGAVPFNTSLQVRHKAAATGTADTRNTVVKYRKTA